MIEKLEWILCITFIAEKKMGQSELIVSEGEAEKLRKGVMIKNGGHRSNR